MDRRKLICLALLAAAGGAFLVDRLFLGEPETATAETVPAPMPRRPTPQRPRPQKTNAEEVTDPSLVRLDQLKQAEADRNIFAPSVPMLKHYGLSADPPEQAQKKDLRETSPELFPREHQLQATFIGNDKLLAVVDGKVLGLGDVIDGFCLTKIEPYRAEFCRGRHCVSLSISLPAKPE